MRKSFDLKKANTFNRGNLDSNVSDASVIVGVLDSLEKKEDRLFENRTGVKNKIDSLSPTEVLGAVIKAKEKEEEKQTKKYHRCKENKYKTTP